MKKTHNIGRNLKKSIVQMNKEGKLIRIITKKCLFEEFGLNYRNVYATIKGYQKTHKGYIFCYLDDYNKGNFSLKNDPIIKLTTKGKFVCEYKNLKDVEYHGHTKNMVYKVLSNKYKQASHGGYLWIKKSDYNLENVDKLVNHYNNIKKEKAVVMIDDNKVVHSFDSISEASRNGYDNAGIIRSIKLNVKYLGHYWQYEN